MLHIFATKRVSIIKPSSEVNAHFNDGTLYLAYFKKEARVEIIVLNSYTVGLFSFTS